MPARPTWKGYPKISLVNIPIKVFPATDAGATLRFNQLHAEYQTRIQQKRWCPHCQREVANTDFVKGFEFEKGRYVVVDEEDIEKVRVESTRVIHLEKFTDDIQTWSLLRSSEQAHSHAGDVVPAGRAIRETML
jgi:DNA end-binding protein Ku